MYRLSLVVIAAAVAAGSTRAADDWDNVVDKAIAYLKSSQNPDGSWGAAPRNAGVTGIVLTGMLQTGKVTPDDPTVAKGLKYIESLVNPKAGHIAGKDPAMQLQNYVTSVNVMALVAANKSDKYKAVIGDAVKFLKKLQWDEDEGKKPEDDFFGGAGYDSKSRPDLSNTQFFLDALKAAGVPAGRPGPEEGADLRQPLPEPQGRAQRPALGRQDQRRQLHLHGGRPAVRPRPAMIPTAPCPATAA